MHAFWTDARNGFRLLVREPVFAFLSIVALAVGIGANTAIFSMVNGILLRPLPYPQSQQLYLIREIVPQMGQMGGTWPANLKNFDAWQRESHSFEKMAVAEPISADFTSASEAVEIDGAHVSANIFDVLGVSVQLGRTFLPEEDQPGHDNVVILTNSFWRGQFQSDPSVLGKSITLNGAANEVIGVLPASFRFPRNDQFGARVQFSSQTQFFKPLGVDLNKVFPLGNFRFAAIARLKSGISPPQALADLDVVQAHIAAGLAKDGGRKIELRAELIPLESEVIGSSRRGLLFLLASVGTVLLIVCVNLAGLLLVRASRRLREAAIRISLGASRGRLIRQMLSEIVPLSLLGGLLGILFAYFGLRWLVNSAPIDLPRLDEVHIDIRVLLFSIMISVGTGILFGSLPAWRVAGIDPQLILRSGGTTMTADRTGLYLRQLLIAFEVALTALLVILAGALTTSLVRVLNVDKGFDADKILTMDVALPPQRYSQPADRLRFYDQTRLGVAGIPSVRSAAWISKLPLEGQAFIAVVNVPGAVQQDYSKLMANFRFASPGYFQSIGIRLLQGRVFDETDRGKNVTVISETVARLVWPGENPIGKQFHPGANNAPLTEVIGIVSDIRTVRLDEPPLSMVYLPYWELQTPSSASLVIRTNSGIPTSVAVDARRIIHNLDPEVPILKIRSMDQIITDSVAGRRFQMMLARSFAACALFLAGLGIFSVVSYSVDQRRHELGIRMALGASPANLRHLVIREGMKPVVFGLIVGIAGAFAVGKAVNRLFFGVRLGDPFMLALATAVVLTLGALACYVPATLTNRISPITALRTQ